MHNLSWLHIEFGYFRSTRGTEVFMFCRSNRLLKVFRYLTQHNLIDCIVTSAGGIEEDLIKCLKPTLVGKNFVYVSMSVCRYSRARFLGDFRLDGSELRQKGLNRAGNLLIPNSNYCAFETWLTPILERVSEEQPQTSWTPSRVRFFERLFGLHSKSLSSSTDLVPKLTTRSLFIIGRTKIAFPSFVRVGSVQIHCPEEVYFNKAPRLT